jgi:hypothetical protein
LIGIGELEMAIPRLDLTPEAVDLALGDLGVGEDVV